MRVVLDTNIVVSALVWGGVPYRLLQFGQTGEIEIVTSLALVAELADVLGRSHLTPLIAAQDMSAMALVTQYQSFTQSVTPQSVPAVIADDPDDDQVLACAVAGHADLIVSGDKHLHSLGGQYNGIPIVKAGEAVRIIEAG
jgi:putative PIN family toxin of toxin-antitoxin system